VNNSPLQKTVAFFKLVRIQNLAIIALTQVLLRYCVLEKVFYSYGLAPELDDVLFVLLVLSTVLIAAGGYVINDYFDLKTDLINHPSTVVVDTVIKRRWAIILHFLFTTAGVLLGMYAALETGYLRLAIFHVVAATLLWFYSTHFKRQLLTGNITVSLLTAAITFIPFIYEMGVMQKVNPGFIYHYRFAVLSSIKYAWIYATFAFITTMAREIIKDLEDIQGDRATGCHTLPIVWGQRSAKLSAFFLLVITAILLMFVVYNTVRWQHQLLTVATVFITVLLIIPVLWLSVYVLRSVTSAEFGRASLVLKLIMLVGLSYSVVFYYL
jgi:4-hydroxybenzoate polyprenyltransferase